MEYCIEDDIVERLVCGIDEVGRGCLAGPVVAAAVIMPGDNRIVDVNDSKKISKKKRERLDAEIRKSALAYGIGIVDEKTIDNINIKQATRVAMKMALENLVLDYRLNPEIVLIDLEEIDTSFPQRALIRGDSISYNIACASILAKVYRDSLFIDFSKQYPGYSFETNMGYGTAAHIKGIDEFGITPIHRMSFLEKILKRMD
ncbi:ribonuclease HII [Microaceticoccus formicicus]|uniref:ribonuclease HII n=1 Tax=Microaceticoccus formicicus TaxID=3118105 RepID=UPI003CD01123|nr:ribonuclease HII [Peptoniphilaceae bacterium AMB_02]